MTENDKIRMAIILICGPIILTYLAREAGRILRQLRKEKEREEEKNDANRPV